MPQFKRLGAAGRAALTFLALATTLSACGFVGASQASPTKPAGFLLYGHAAVSLPAGDQRGTGMSCVAPPSINGVATGASVIVLDPAGKIVAAGVLDDGVVAHSGSGSTCDFAFSILGVPGGADMYFIKIGHRAAQQFSGEALRRNTPAIITIAS